MSHKDPKEVFKTVLSFILILMLVIFVLAGCTTVPVTAKFPAKPADTEKCIPLQKLTDNAKLSDVSSVINDNYAEYYKCSVKNDTWNEWYETQKRIFEGVSK